MEKESAVRSDMTKKMLAASLKKLLSKKPLQAITVTDITSLCGVHRQTFYYHFKDTGTLLRWLFEEEAKTIIADADITRGWQDLLLQMFHYLETNRAFSISVFRSIGRETLREYFGPDLTLIVSKIISGYGAEIPGLNKDIEYLTAFYLGAVLGILERWLLGELDWTPEEIVAYTEKIAEAQLTGAKVMLALKEESTP